jgi:hypothetical protein
LRVSKHCWGHIGQCRKLQCPDKLLVEVWPHP